MPQIPLGVFGFAAGVGFAVVALPRRYEETGLAGLALISRARGDTRGQPKTEASFRQGKATAAKPTQAAKPKPRMVKYFSGEGLTGNVRADSIRKLLWEFL